MLNLVPIAQRTAARVMVTRHPNAIDCQVYRKTVIRSAFAGPATVGGLPTLGGVAVLDNEEEAEFSYELLGDAKIVFLGIYERTTLHDSRASAEQQDTSEALIEPETPGAFEPKDSDLVMVMPGAGVIIPYEVSNVLNTTMIPPYMPKYELKIQGDLISEPEFVALQEAKPEL